jgi:hypothetical protein
MTKRDKTPDELVIEKMRRIAQISRNGKWIQEGRVSANKEPVKKPASKAILARQNPRKLSDPQHPMNPNNPASLLNPNNPANPNSRLNPSNPHNPASFRNPNNPMNPNSIFNPNSPTNPNRRR